MGTKIVRKLTIRDVIGSKTEILKIAQTGQIKAKDAEGNDVVLPEGNWVKLCTFIGRVAKATPGQGDNGEFLKLAGEFEATNLISGEVIPASNAILPNFVSDAIGNAMNVEGAQAVEFAVVISVRYKETAAVMYEFSAESLLPPQQAQSVSALKAMLANQGIALPAPKNLAIAPPAHGDTQSINPPVNGEVEPETTPKGKKK